MKSNNENVDAEPKYGMGCGGMLLLSIVASVIIIVISVYTIPYIAILLILVPFATISANNDTKKEDAFKYRYSLQNIPQGARNITILQGNGVIWGGVNTVWLEGNTLKFFPITYKDHAFSDIRNFFTTELSVNSIQYYATRGDFYTETAVSGGGGGGMSIGKAIVGGAIAGTAGAIVLGSKKVKDVKSETVINDTRSTTLFYNINGQTIQIKLGMNDYDTLFQILPSKSYDVVVKHMN